jgi:hypothetical protein
MSTGVLIKGKTVVKAGGIEKGEEPMTDRSLLYSNNNRETKTTTKIEIDHGLLLSGLDWAPQRDRLSLVRGTKP